MKTDLQRSPIYQQLNERLRNSLASDYRRGDRFLTEREISEAFSVSRATANKALASLVSEGMLEFRRGIGTFVRRELIEYDLRSLVSFTEKAHSVGKRPSTVVLQFESVRAGEFPEVQVRLDLNQDDMLWNLKRVRSADRTPVILEHRFIVRSLCEKLTRSQAKGSLYSAWTNSHGIKIGALTK